MDTGSGLSKTPAREISADEGCRSCAIVQWVADQGAVDGVPFVAEIANEGAVVLSGPQFTGFVVIPRQCVGGLEDLAPPGRALVLAALRLATLRVRNGNLGPITRTVVMNDTWASSGHVSFQVLPVDSDDETSPALWPVPPTICVTRSDTAIARAESAR